MREKESLLKQKIGYESSEMMYGIKKNGKQSDERIYSVRHDLLLPEFEQLHLFINELKNYGIGLFETKMKRNQNQSQREKICKPNSIFF